MKIQPSYYIYILRTITIISALLSIVLSTSHFITFNLIYVDMVLDTIAEVASYIVILIQCLLAIISALFGNSYFINSYLGVGFHLRKKELDALPQTIAAMTNLSLLGLLGFLNYATVVITKFLFIYEKECEPVVFLTIIVVREVSSLLWFTILLPAFRVRNSNAKLKLSL